MGLSRCETYTQCSAGVETQLCSITANSFGGTTFDGHILYLNPDIELSNTIWSFLSRFELPAGTVPPQRMVSGVGLLHSGRTRNREPPAWTVTLGNQTWTVADGQGHVYAAAARRLGKPRTFVLTPTDEARAMLGIVLTGKLTALGAPAGDVTIDSRDTLRGATDRDGMPVQVKGVLRLLRGGAPAGRFVVRLKR